MKSKAAVVVLMVVSTILNVTNSLYLFNSTGTSGNSSLFNNEDFSCPDGDDCKIICGEENTCRNAHIKCPKDYECTIECSAENACSNSKINAANSTNLTVIGSYIYALASADIINGPINSLDIECTSAYSCGNFEMFIDKTDKITWKCDANYACGYSELEITNVNTLDIECASSYSCYYMKFNKFENINSVSFDVQSYGAGNGLVIDKLKDVKTFYITCEETQACDNTVLRLDNVTENVYVTCNAYESCERLTVYCPQEKDQSCTNYCDLVENNGTSMANEFVEESKSKCNIFCAGESDSCSSAEIYSYYGIDGIELTCEGTDSCGDLSIGCGECELDDTPFGFSVFQFQYSCKLEYDDENNEYICSSSSNEFCGESVYEVCCSNCENFDTSNTGGTTYVTYSTTTAMEYLLLTLFWINVLPMICVICIKCKKKELKQQSAVLQIKANSKSLNSRNNINNLSNLNSQNKNGIQLEEIRPRQTNGNNNNNTSNGDGETIGGASLNENNIGNGNILPLSINSTDNYIGTFNIGCGWYIFMYIIWFIILESCWDIAVYWGEIHYEYDLAMFGFILSIFEILNLTFILTCLVPNSCCNEFNLVDKLTNTLDYGMHTRLWTKDSKCGCIPFWLEVFIRFIIKMLWIANMILVVFFLIVFCFFFIFTVVFTCFCIGGRNECVNVSSLWLTSCGINCCCKRTDSKLEDPIVHFWIVPRE